MWAIVGLGNPGRKYSRTRHNIGFMVIEALASKYRIPLKGRAGTYIYGKGLIEDVEAILIEPVTFMNQSGIAVKALLKTHGLTEKTLIIIHDDIDMEPGRLRVRAKGSSGGHRGVQSIIDIIGTRNFIRLKIGVGRSSEIPPEEFVLEPFRAEEKEIIKESIERAVDALTLILTNGIDATMNRLIRK
ncbi:MAG TPA: aminoacyl-tRNA hydrolase [Nitrospiraceae bacterium]|nr:aminoacyl-tRNA hydrolase [Nitrospiraceae bacterium]